MQRTLSCYESFLMEGLIAGQLFSDIDKGCLPTVRGGGD